MQPWLAIPVVMALLLGLLWWLGRRGMVRVRGALLGRRSPRGLELIARLPLTPQHSLHVVRTRGKDLLIGTSPGGCALVESWESDQTGGAA